MPDDLVAAEASARLGQPLERREDRYGGTLFYSISGSVPVDTIETIESTIDRLAARAADTARWCHEQTDATRRRQRPIYEALGRLMPTDIEVPRRRALEEVLKNPRFTPPDWTPDDFDQVRDYSTLISGTRHIEEIHQRPFDYDWQWHTGTNPSQQITNRNTGQIELQGGVTGGDYQDVHGGFGVVLRNPLYLAVRGVAPTRTDQSWVLGAGSFGGDATTEGGVELTVLDGPDLLKIVQDKRWRMRKSNGEDSEKDFGGWDIGNFYQDVPWGIVGGHTYTFNVGLWQYVEANDGFGPFIGDSVAWTHSRAEVLYMGKRWIE
jgi:hypothetical protein